MAVGVAEAQVQVTVKVSLGGTRYLYVGTIAFGTEYATGGDTLAAATGSRYTVPAQIDYLHVSGMSGYGSEFVAPNKLKVTQPAKEKEAAAEVAAKTNLSAITAARFIAIGC